MSILAHNFMIQAIDLPSEEGDFDIGKSSRIPGFHRRCGSYIGTGKLQHLVNICVLHEREIKIQVTLEEKAGSS